MSETTEKKKLKITSFKEGKAFKGFSPYFVEMNDGIKYEWWTKEGNRFPWKNGDEIEFDLEVKDSDRGKRYKMKNGRKAGEAKVGSSYNDPGVIKKMAMSISIGYAIKWYNATAEDPTSVSIDHITRYAERIYGWIIDVTPFDRDSVNRRWYAIEHAMNYCIMTDNFDLRISEVAEDLLKPVLSAE